MEEVLSSETYRLFFIVCLSHWFRLIWFLMSHLKRLFLHCTALLVFTGRVCRTSLVWDLHRHFLTDGIFPSRSGRWAFSPGLKDTYIDALGKCYREGSAQTFQRFKGQTCSEIGDNSQINKHQKVTPSVWCFDCKSHRSSFVWVFVSLSLWCERRGLIGKVYGLNDWPGQFLLVFCVKWCNGLFCMDCTVHKSKY